MQSIVYVSHHISLFKFYSKHFRTLSVQLKFCVQDCGGGRFLSANLDYATLRNYSGELCGTYLSGFVAAATAFYYYFVIKLVHAFPASIRRLLFHAAAKVFPQNLYTHSLVAFASASWSTPHFRLPSGNCFHCQCRLNWTFWCSVALVFVFF